MITKEEYLKALDIVEAYHEQLNLASVRRSCGITIKEWLDGCSPKPSKRLYKALVYGTHNGTVYKYLDEIDKQIYRIRGIGRKLGNEFTELLKSNCA